ncbi:GNAT family N-acetyltransferase [Teredinibacter purpureus]|uniref:hypothetical protein n=1 Tax=Teredinibacter purpureus TaxID=2731756 RepID=UPI0038B4B7EF
MLRWAKAKSIKEIYLGTVDTFFAAHRFYEKNDFELCEKTHLPKTFPLVNVGNDILSALCVVAGHLRIGGNAQWLNRCSFSAITAMVFGFYVTL